MKQLSQMSYDELAEQLAELERTEQVKMYRKVKAKIIELDNKKPKQK